MHVGRVCVHVGRVCVDEGRVCVDEGRVSVHVHVGCVCACREGTHVWVCVGVCSVRDW